MYNSSRLGILLAALLPLWGWGVSGREPASKKHPAVISGGSVGAAGVYREVKDNQGHSKSGAGMGVHASWDAADLSSKPNGFYLLSMEGSLIPDGHFKGGDLSVDIEGGLFSADSRRSGPCGVYGSLGNKMDMSVAHLSGQDHTDFRTGFFSIGVSTGLGCKGERSLFLIGPEGRVVFRGFDTFMGRNSKRDAGDELTSELEYGGRARWIHADKSGRPVLAGSVSAGQSYAFEGASNYARGTANVTLGPVALGATASHRLIKPVELVSGAPSRATENQVLVHVSGSWK